VSRRIIQDEEFLSCTDWTSSLLPKDASISRRYHAVSRLRDGWRINIVGNDILLKSFRQLESLDLPAQQMLQSMLGATEGQRI